uniref:adenylyl-sulfate kinase n=1 Tax=Plectus sambesii TaxID=2011161 RepID=A0A914X0Z2_9BILA
MRELEINGLSKLIEESVHRATNVTIQHHEVGRELRAEILGKHGGFRGCTIWFTGYSGAGKTTISFALERTLCELGLPAYGLDGDNMRHGVCANLGFTPADREENIRRVAEVSKLFADMGVICLSSFISPYEKDRLKARQIHEQSGLDFIEVFVNTSLEVCESRDIKGLYAKARAGKIPGFTGIDSDYEPPTNPELTVDAGNETEAQSVQRVLQYLYQKKILPEKAMQQLCGPPVRELFVSAAERADKTNSTAEMPRVDITEVDLQWLQVLAEGWATPLYGFMRERQYLQCMKHGLLLDLKPKCTEPGQPDEDNLPEYMIPEPINQSIPIVLPIDDAVRGGLIDEKGAPKASKVALWYNGKPVAILSEPEIFPHYKMDRVARQFGTIDDRHPTIKLILDSGDWLLGGDIEVLDRIKFNDGLDEYRLTPMELRNKFADQRADAVFAFQLRNPIHNGHARLMADTRAQLLKKHKNPMLLLHPLGGWTKDDDVPLDVRMRQHHAVLEDGQLLDPSWTWHARARMAAGVHTYIVGRDPAGIQKPGTADFLYDPTHGAKVLSMAPGLPNLEIVPFRVAAYDTKNGEMAYFDPARKDDFLFISGTKMRGFARDGVQPPHGFMVPQAWTVLSDYYKQLAEEQSRQKNG